MSDELINVVPNDMACEVTYICLHARRLSSTSSFLGNDADAKGGTSESFDKQCWNVFVLLTKLILVKHIAYNVGIIIYYDFNLINFISFFFFLYPNILFL